MSASLNNEVPGLKWTWYFLPSSTTMVPIPPNNQIDSISKSKLKVPKVDKTDAGRYKAVPSIAKPNDWKFFIPQGDSFKYDLKIGMY